MEGLGRIVVKRVDDDAGNCVGIEVDHGMRILTFDRQSHGLRSSRFPATLERETVFDTTIHCNQKEPKPCEESS